MFYGANARFATAAAGIAAGYGSQGLCPGAFGILKSEGCDLPVAAMVLTLIAWSRSRTIEANSFRLLICTSFGVLVRNAVTDGTLSKNPLARQLDAPVQMVPAQQLTDKRYPMGHNIPAQV